ncbi:hypothetical protein BIV57_15770 [Mangrovactinospora gilvigrisea]|uniref:Anti-sigma factor antagonist n=1 Tax=Mangrovactinospora gilvigrisea TaxID=1428644 RepID=A0A1J7BST5_9ACTN|nr:STAS domain-containing protein [Mangrovactinospora gilvigrisea]OIV36529.1 hypothetical protein BIV57_15770 [Mangrovactinospora gilvigrisea]
MPLAVGEQEVGNWSVLRLRGALDLASAGRVRAAVHAVVATGGRRLVLDLTGVRFCDSTGVGVLIAARRLMRSCAGELRLVVPPGDSSDGTAVDRIFSALGVRRLFAIHARVEDAAEVAAEGSEEPPPVDTERTRSGSDSSDSVTVR